MTLIENIKLTFEKHFSKTAEVFIVLTLGFGLFIYNSTSVINSNKISITTQTYNSFDFIFIIIYEIISLTIIASFLKKRNWTLKDFNLDFTLKMIGVAILLVVVREMIGAILLQILYSLSIFNKTIDKSFILIQSNIFSTGLIVIVNSIYEEVLLTGYLFKRFEKYHPSLVIIFSFIIRASYHTYQGWTKLPMVFIMALIFGVYYIKFKKLWPIIIAHGIGNIFYFLNIHYQWINTM